MMSSPLLVAFNGHSSFLQIRAFKNGVFTEFMLYGNHGMLEGFFLLLFFCDGILRLRPHYTARSGGTIFVTSNPDVAWQTWRWCPYHGWMPF